MEIITDQPGKKILLLGNEAITRGALEAGVDVATTYPGTPSSEIADTFSHITKYFTKKGDKPPFYFEYSTNEKVALEVAAAASFSGLRALTCMKHVGLNVASDAFMTYTYVGCKGGHIIVSADDPYCHSSQNEQDNRYFAIFGGAPMLEPTTPQEAKEMTGVGFDISEQLSLPLLLRTTTRLSHARGPVVFEKMQKPRGIGHFEKNPLLVTVPAVARKQHPVLLERMEQAEKISEKSQFNEVVNVGKPKDIGVVSSGVSFNYAKEMAETLSLDVRILKLGMTHPIPRRMCEKFIKSCSTIVVIEELEPILEQQFKTLAFDMKSDVKIFGKSTGRFSRLYEYNPDIVVDVFSKIFKVKNPFPKPVESKIKLPSRPPSLCPGCPHRATYYAVKKAAPKDSIYPTDIGCYTLGKEPPLEMADVLLCMGSNAGTACGFAVSTGQKIVSFMGDSTFFHAAIPALIDAVHHNHDVVITVLDNRTTAMTGHQPHPGTEFDGMGRPAKMIRVEDVARGCGVEHIEIVDPNNIKETTAAFKRALDFKGPSFVVSKSPCILLEVDRKRKAGEEIPVYSINQELCKRCKTCIGRFGCPALYFAEDGSVHIDTTLCNGCGNCVQVCPFGAISKSGVKE
ncbi:MAG: indolepyruvate ferredoxin oxidoreductase subunit alpha [Candidatus Thermoplasmatota archaeon]|jgi:indolepyruvate ferredoxin oxidoreductase alpha subunit|nr:indolepyruvate ferredoxin oxidoreductase subunit alpha [Candidatus Thermoplasmatota archaeon]